MAEVTALTPSPPARADPSVPSSPPLPPPLIQSLPAEAPKTTPVPKSSLYGDKSMMAAVTSSPTTQDPEAPSGAPSAPPRSHNSSPPPEQSDQNNVSPGAPDNLPAPLCTESNSTPDPSPTLNTPLGLPHSPPAVVPLSEHKFHPPALVFQGSSAPPVAPPQSGPALDTLSYLESASVMSGTLESLSGIGEDGSSIGSDSELNGPALRRTDKYGFLGGAQYTEGQ